MTGIFLREVGGGLWGEERGLRVLFGILGGVALGFCGCLFCLGGFVGFFKGTHLSMTEKCIKLQMGPGNQLQISVPTNVKEYRWAQTIY